LTDKSFVSVLTCSPGGDLYESFGHTALRICDTSIGLDKGIDYVFNFGIFNFNENYFYFRFAQGKLSYMLAISDYQSFVNAYNAEGRVVYEQRLNLTLPEKQKLWDSLEINYLPQNRYYQYDFFKDNCATRIRDIVAYALIDRTFQKNENKLHNRTFRQKFHDYTANYSWWVLGIDIALGLPADKRASDWEYMYLPMDLMEQLDTTLIVAYNQPLAIDNQQIITQLKQQSEPSAVPPLLVFGILFAGACILSLLEYKKKFYGKIFDIILFLLAFVVSLPVFFLTFLSDHTATIWNLDLLIFNPLLIITLIRLRKTPQWILYLLLFCLLVATVYHLIFLQTIGIAPIFILLTIALRLALLLVRKKKGKKSE
jgi:hypothetical protein